jgi:AmmeMemoRadiSam system protein B
MENLLSGIVLLLALMISASPANPSDPTPQELLATVGIPPTDGERGQMDTVGFATSGEQMLGVVRQSKALATPRQDVLRGEHGWGDKTTFAAAVCPHDDYYYAGRLYALLMPYLNTDTVILFGVFHKARVWNLSDKLVFDSFDSWRGPFGPVKVSPIREEILSRLPEGDYVVDNDMQQVEHSVEAIVPWLQAYNPDVQIVSILVPYMDWETMDRLAVELSDALAVLMREKGWQLGRDVSVIASSDATHYGDAGWGGSNYATFGTDAAGYQKAVNRDLHLAESTLCGPVTRPSLERFLYTCVDRRDVSNYLLTWCGRFSVPFGLDVASRLNEELNGQQLVGTLLGYGTSLGEVSLDVDSLGSLGVTAPNNLHHWVGYPAIGYQSR